jgi:hypothetical protein
MPTAWAARASMMSDMSKLQMIHHNERLAAVVVAGQAIIDDTLSPHALASVQAKCLYALELAEKGDADLYTDDAAEAYARTALRGG